MSDTTLTEFSHTFTDTLLRRDNVAQRDYAADIEVRSDGTGRTVHGVLVPYNQVARVSDGGPSYEEMFAPGAFARDILARAGDFRGVKLLYQHNHREPIGRAVELRDDTAGVYGAFRIAATARGDEALELLRDGVIDAFSVGFRAINPPLGEVPADGPVIRTKAGIRETSLVTFPAYAGALVAGVRAIEPPLDTVEGSADSTAETLPDQPLPDPDPAPEPLHSGLANAQRRAWLLNNLTLRSH